MKRENHQWKEDYSPNYSWETAKGRSRLNGHFIFSPPGSIYML